MALQVASSARVAVSHSSHRPVSTAAGHDSAVGGQRHAPDRAGVALQRGRESPASPLPQPHRPIKSTAGHQLAVGGQRHARPCRCGPQRLASARPVAASHRRTCAIGTRTGQQPPVSGQRQAPHRRVVLQGGHGLPLSACHSRTVPSPPPLASSSPSADSATPQTAPVWPCTAQAACGPPPATARPARRRARGQQRAVATQGNRAGEIERFSQDALGEVGIHEACVLASTCAR